MNSNKKDYLERLLTGFINCCYPDGLKICTKKQLPKEIQDNLSEIVPILNVWEKKGYIKFNGKDDNFFEVLKQID